ncbi:MAG: protein translocase subunit SecF [Desulfobacterales bacterium]|jgi:preprotein translocase subunit SecF
MQFIKSSVNIDFIGKRKAAFILSAAMILVSLIFLTVNKGLRYGIDFAGGSEVTVRFGEAVELKELRSILEQIGVANASIQQFEGELGGTQGNSFLIRSDQSEEGAKTFVDKIKTDLQEATGKSVEIRKFEMVGPQVGQDLQEQALFAMFFTLLFITIYISGRFELKWVLSGVMAGALAGAVYLLSIFNVSIPFLILAALIVALVLFWFLELKYAMGAIVALIHDVTITVGLFSIFDKEFTLPIIAALLTIIGYSLNDTIIVFDRIRENLRKYHRLSLGRIINRSINETLSRTLLTSMTTLSVVVALFVLGGGIIHDFAFALIIGVLVGTYSSVFVASPILLAWQGKGNAA